MCFRTRSTYGCLFFYQLFDLILQQIHFSIFLFAPAAVPNAAGYFYAFFEHAFVRIEKSRESKRTRGIFVIYGQSFKRLRMPERLHLCICR